MYFKTIQLFHQLLIVFPIILKINLASASGDCLQSERIHLSSTVFKNHTTEQIAVQDTQQMKKLGNRMKLLHINDRGCNKTGPYMTPILKQNATELGSGNIDLETLTAMVLENGVQGIILETYQNWINDDPIKSLQISAAYLH